MSSNGNQAAWLDAKGSRLRVGAAEMPKPGADEVVVKNGAVAINPVDWKIQDYGIFAQKFPLILGCDVAGEVVAVGESVKKFKKGDRVMAHAIWMASSKDQDAGFQLYTAVPAVTTSIIPESMSYAQASVLPLAVNTASHGLFTKKEGFLALEYPSLDPKPSGKTIVVWGGSSSVGALTIQLATAAGANVIAVASARNHDFVRKLGASEAVDYNNNPSVVEDVVKAVKFIGGEFAGIFDAISDKDGSLKYTFPLAQKLNAPAIACVLPKPEDMSPPVKYGAVYAINDEVNAPLWETYVTQALEQGKLKTVPEPLVIGKGLDSIQKGLDANKAGVSAKKVVVEL